MKQIENDPSTRDDNQAYSYMKFRNNIITGEQAVASFQDKLKREKEERRQLLQDLAQENLSKLMDIDFELEEAKGNPAQWKELRKKAKPELSHTRKINNRGGTEFVGVMGEIKKVELNKINLTREHRQLYQKLLKNFHINLSD
jgi:hypothetical protein